MARTKVKKKPASRKVASKAKPTTRKPAAKTPALDLGAMTPGDKAGLGSAFCSFLDAAVTDSGRATFYNSKEEQDAASLAIHTRLLSIDRSVYSLSLLLPGASDRTRQQGLSLLLDTHRSEDGVLTREQEARLVSALVREMPPQRMLKTFCSFREKKINNSRSTKLMLRYILGSDKLDWWAVKYRDKIATVLRHCWGTRMTSVIQSILSKRVHSEKEAGILRKNVFRFAPVTLPSKGDVASRASIQEVLKFVLRVPLANPQIPLLKAYEQAKVNISAGRKLPPEVLEGIRSKYHKEVPRSTLLELVKDTVTGTQAMSMQRQFKEAGVKAPTFDPLAQDPVKLYVYAMEMGMTSEIRAALDSKAKKAADQMPIKYGTVGILVDCSLSMSGHETQKNKPMAVVLATRDMLQHVGRKSVVRYAGGVDGQLGLVSPQGDTGLAEQLVAVLKENPDAVFILTDGYENAPAGRIDEVVRAVKWMGIKTPIHQISPVLAAEAGGVRVLSAEIPSLPISSPMSMGLTLLKSMFEIDVGKGIAALLEMTTPILEGKE